jgi:hypothetical protein
MSLRADYYNSYDQIDDDVEEATQKPRRPPKDLDADEEEHYNKTQQPVYVTDNFYCDRKGDLYVLNQQKFIQGNSFTARSSNVTKVIKKKMRFHFDV